ncbi:zinc finger protein [Macleaya cordata]|uniref:Zinc finger protein n=1 Tax=Macleaya cordata TaxID=56857 RepID=A0A200Q155_MACCD|nr:zinc finger protein [Macleaya cordata]
MFHEEIKCQICEQTSHLAIECPFVYSECKQCGGIRMIGETNTEKNPNRKFLRCQYANCDEFQWLDESIVDSMSSGALSSPNPK